MEMKHLFSVGLGLALFFLSGCGQTPQQPSSVGNTAKQCTDSAAMSQSFQNQVIETIMARRSVRKYKPTAIESEKLSQLLECGINAPNGMYKQSWELRVVNTPEVMADFEKAYVAYQTRNGKKRISHPSFGAPCLIFIAHDTTYDLSQVDCGLLGENMILAAQSMGLGTCCLGGLVRFMYTPEAKSLLERLDIPASYKLLYAIAVGYPDESPAAKPRNTDKIKFVD